VDYLVLGILAGLAAVERRGFLQAMLSRPIALGPVVGLALGDLAGGLRVGAPLELLWMGAVNLGAALPVHEALGASAIIGGAVLAGRTLQTGVTPAVAILAVLICAPLALLGRKADRLTEIVNERLSARALLLVDRGEPEAAVRENLYGLALPFGISCCLAPFGAAVARWAIPALLRALPALAGALAAGWLAFGGLACAAGAATLRTRSHPSHLFLGSLLAGVLAGVVVWGVRR
jgi:mannose/fructose/N-acetylgalactosamine-specific phosphotransferase system component IIC